MFERLSDDAMLPRNRVRAKRWLKRKRQVTLGAFAILLAIAFLVPVQHVMKVWVVFFGVFMLLLGVIEYQRVMIFRKDLHDRRGS